MTNGQFPIYPSDTGQPGVQQPAQPQQPLIQQPPMQQAGYPVSPGVTQQSQQPAQQPVAMAPGQVPQYNLPDESAVAQAYQAHKQETATWGSGGDRPQFVKWPGPNGQIKWDNTVPIGYEASVYVYILPPWAPDKNIFRIVRSHFWKSYANPGGRSIGCPGNDQCLICQAREAAMSHPDPQVQERAKNFGRVRTQHLYNVVQLENPNGHFGEDGQMKPFILGAGAWLHKAIGDIIEDKAGAINIVDPIRGRPIRLKRSKNGPNMMDIQYAAIGQDPAPLPPHFYPCLQNIHDLDKQDRQPKHEDMVKAVQEMGLPLPANMGVPAAPTNYQATPPPVAQSPYPTAQAGVGQPGAPTYMPPPADPYEFPPPVPVQQQPMQSPQQFEGSQPWQQSTGPAMPPPLQSISVETSYVAQPGQGVPAPPPPGTPGAQQFQAVPPAPAVTAPGQIQQSVPGVVTSPQQSARQPVVQAPVTRPPCFGKHNPQDRTCQACPDQLKGECVAQAGQLAPGAQPAQNLNELQIQLTGGQ